jgi:hypothetical protein
VAFLNWERTPAISVSFQVFIFVGSVLLIALLNWKITQGRNWARMTYLVLFLITIVPAVFAVAIESLFSAVSAILVALEFIIPLYALWLLFTSPGRSWFERARDCDQPSTASGTATSLSGIDKLKVQGSKPRGPLGRITTLAMTVGGLFVLLVLVLASLSHNKNRADYAKQTSTSTSQYAVSPVAQNEQSQPVSTPVVEKHKIGETFPVGYWTYRCNGTHWQQRIGRGLLAENPDAAFLVVDMTIRNDDKTSSTLPPMKLVDAQGREYDESSKGSFTDGSFGMLKDLNPGVSSRGFVVFDVPPHGDYALKVSGGFESGEDTLVDLSETNASAPTNASVSTPASAVVQPEYSGEREQHFGRTTNAPMSTPETTVVQPAESQPAARQPSSASSQPASTTQAAAPTMPQAVREPAAPPPPLPPQPLPSPLLVPAGTTLVVRMSNSLTSKTANIGDGFTGTLAQPVTVDGVVAIPSGASVSGSVTDVKSPGRFKGEGVLAITLNSINLRGVPTTIATSAYSQTAKGKGERTAVALGGGTGVGALIGGLAGGGRGAGIGAVIGAGAGTVGAAVTGNKALEIPVESVVTFKLAESITVKRSSLAQ